MIRRLFVKAGGAALLALAAGLTMASGTDGAGSAETGNAALYNMGKSVYASKLACSGCPMAGKSLDAGLARELLGKPTSAVLSADETAALQMFLKRRFKL